MKKKEEKMNVFPLTQDDYQLIEEAKSKIKDLYQDDKLHVGSALRTNSGNIVSAVHIEAYVGRITVCAEAIAIGSAISNGEKGFIQLFQLGIHIQMNEIEN